MAKQKIAAAKAPARAPRRGITALKKAAKSPGIKKKYLKTKPFCQVTFQLPGEAAPGAGVVCIVGDFNNWNISSHPMQKQKSGDFSLMLELEPGRQYQYRYLIDESRWENDWHADAYVTSPYGDSENSVVIL